MPLTGPIELRDYDSRWPDVYAEHAARIRGVLGDRAVRIEHDWFEHRLLRPPDGAAHLHVFSACCAETDRMVRFRDWLRANDADRELYLATKRDLAARDWKYMQQYADAKSDVVNQIIARAMAD